MLTIISIFVDTREIWPSETWPTTDLTGLPETCGFFFGASDGTETEDDLAFVAKARDRVKKGYTVFYDSWW